MTMPAVYAWYGLGSIGAGWPARTLINSFVDIKDAAVLKLLEKDGFLEGSDEDYASVREAMQHNGAFFQ